MMNISIKQPVLNTARSDEGVTSIEYGLIAGAIALAMITAVSFTGANTKQVFCTVAGTVGGSPCTQKVIYNASNSYNIPTTGYNSGFFGAYSVLMAQDNIKSLTGFYDAYGNELNTPESFFNAVGFGQAYINFANGVPGSGSAFFNPPTGSGIYIPDPSKVTMTDTSGHIDTSSFSDNNNSAVISINRANGYTQNIPISAP